MVAAASAPSRALLEANRRLQQLRAASAVDAGGRSAQVVPDGVGRSKTIVDGPPAGAGPDVRRPDLRSRLADLPEHLGWESAAITNSLRASRRLRTRSTAPATEQRRSAETTISQSVGEDGNDKATAATVKLYPDIALGMLRQELAAAGRLWLLLRYLDQAGGGWLRIDLIQHTLTHKKSNLRLCGQRQLRNLLKQGRGVFWEQDKERIWLRSAAKVAKSLGVARLTGRPVAMPVEALLGGIGQVRAHFYASFHSGRRSKGPISRAKLEKLTSVPARTQRIYDAAAGVVSQRNIAIGDRYSAKEVQERAWRHGQGTFAFIDTKGLQGPAGRRYVAWQLPNSYQGCHAQSTRGRQKKINQQIDLVNRRAQGNGLERDMSREKFDRLFHANGLEAGKAYNRRGGLEVYWLDSGMGKRRYSTQLWHLLAGNKRSGD